MILATHALAGAVIGKNIQNPWIIIVLSLAFHYILDAVKHGEYVESFDHKVTIGNTWWKVALDLLLGLMLVFSTVLFKKFDFLTTRNIFIGVFFSMLPDLFTLVYWKTRWKFFEKLYKFHTWCHRFPPFSSEREWKLSNEIYETIIFIFLLAIILI
jgi:hypothetical protein